MSALPTRIRIGETDLEALTYDGTLPGPVITLNEGEAVRLAFHNALHAPTNLHLHGLQIPPQADDPHRVVAPGQTVTHAFELLPESAGTYWYHPHAHGRVTRQQWSGLAGALIVRGAPDRLPELAAASEHVLVLQDLSVEQGLPAPHAPMEWMSGKEGQHLLVNGQIHPVLEAATGLVRLRLINASVARYYHLAVPGHPLHLIGQDGSFLEAPQPVNTLLLSPGERADLLLQVPAAARLELHDLPYARSAHATPRAAATPLATLEVRGPQRPAHLPARLRPLRRLADADARPDRVVVFGASMDPPRFLVNGQSYDRHRIDLEVRQGSTEVWELRNPTRMDHPFHLHVFPFQVLTRNGVPEPFLAWRDVINLRAGETVRIALDFSRFSGDVMLHCHIAEHEDRGMMANVRVRPPEVTL
nr:multicopper oxidase family protein [Deinobacterium chartae]